MKKQEDRNGRRQRKRSRTTTSWRRRTTWRLAGSATGARPQSAGRSIGRPTRRKPTGRQPARRRSTRRRSTRRPARWTEGRPGRNKTLRVVLSTPEAHDELSHQRYSREPSCFVGREEGLRANLFHAPPGLSI